MAVMGAIHQTARCMEGRKRGRYLGMGRQQGWEWGVGNVRSEFKQGPEF